MKKYHSAKSSCKAFLILAAFALFFPCVIVSVSATPTFTEVTTTAFGTQSTWSWGNPIWGDIDGDGDLDVIIPSFSDGTPPTPAPLVYLNKNDHLDGFTGPLDKDVSGIKPVIGSDSLDWTGYAFGDFDQDGYVDLVVTASILQADPPTAPSILLFHNRRKDHPDSCSGSLSPCFDRYPDATLGMENGKAQSAFWLDFDNDGTLDLFIKNYFAGANQDCTNPDNCANLLFGYSGGSGGTFSPLSLLHDLNEASCRTSNPPCGHSNNCSFARFSINDIHMNAAFSDQTPAIYQYDLTQSQPYTETYVVDSTDDYSRGVAWGDYDNDGHPDLYIAWGSVNGGTLTNALLHYNSTTNRYDSIVPATIGIDTHGYNTWSAVWGDFDNDGYLDLFVTCSGKDANVNPSHNTNFLFRNQGPSLNYNFVNMPNEGVQLANDGQNHKTAACVDYNKDGFLDLTIKDGVGSPGGDIMHASHGSPRLFRNQTTPGNNNHWVEINLKGKTTGTPRSNRFGIGAIAQLTYGSTILTRVNNGGGGGEYASQGSQPLHFGIGAATSGTVDVYWPSGIHDSRSLTSTDLNKINTITEGCCSP